jgi:hypothetical protein
MTSPHQDINRILIFKKLIPCQYGIYRKSKILILGQIGSWYGISWKWKVGYMISKPGPQP